MLGLLMFMNPILVMAWGIFSESMPAISCMSCLLYGLELPCPTTSTPNFSLFSMSLPPSDRPETDRLQDKMVLWYKKVNVCNTKYEEYLYFYTVVELMDHTAGAIRRIHRSA